MLGVGGWEGGTVTTLQYSRCALCAARTDAQSWASGLAKKNSVRSKKRAAVGPRPLTRAVASTAARPGDAAGRRGVTALTQA
ncbi:hypothetical protein NDU88_007244 [Pleurodeles waltl]|uniref:Uncharacterized protein n=1 Tax=Pleurodeles waltl TaxID=8319 RepID=A0AAV7MHG5_PLEWA|nr:hypothetical protein NDU88_007244 [Pleurodeles waltl]